MTGGLLALSWCEHNADGEAIFAFEVFWIEGGPGREDQESVFRVGLDAGRSVGHLGVSSSLGPGIKGVASSRRSGLRASVRGGPGGVCSGGRVSSKKAIIGGFGFPWRVVGWSTAVVAAIGRVRNTGGGEYTSLCITRKHYSVVLFSQVCPISLSSLG